MSYIAKYIDHKGKEKSIRIIANNYKEAAEKTMSLDGIYIMKSVERVNSYE